MARDGHLAQLRPARQQRRLPAHSLTGFLVHSRVNIRRVVAQLGLHLGQLLKAAPPVQPGDQPPVGRQIFQPHAQQRLAIVRALHHSLQRRAATRRLPLQQGNLLRFVRLRQQLKRTLAERVRAARRALARSPASRGLALSGVVRNFVGKAQKSLDRSNSQRLGNRPQLGHLQRLNLVYRRHGQHQPLPVQAQLAPKAQRVGHPCRPGPAVRRRQISRRVASRLSRAGLHQPKLLGKPLGQRVAPGAQRGHALRQALQLPHRARRQPKRRAARRVHPNGQHAHAPRQRGIVLPNRRAQPRAFSMVLPFRNGFHGGSSRKSKDTTSIHLILAHYTMIVSTPPTRFSLYPVLNRNGRKSARKSRINYGDISPSGRVPFTRIGGFSP